MVYCNWVDDLMSAWHEVRFLLLLDIGYRNMLVPSHFKIDFFSQAKHV